MRRNKKKEVMRINEKLREVTRSDRVSSRLQIKFVENKKQHKFYKFCLNVS